jgi:hypothetical protein
VPANTKFSTAHIYCINLQFYISYIKLKLYIVKELWILNSTLFATYLQSTPMNNVFVPYKPLWNTRRSLVAVTLRNNSFQKTWYRQEHKIQEADLR